MDLLNDHSIPTPYPHYEGLPESEILERIRSLNFGNFNSELWAWFTSVFAPRVWDYNLPSHLVTFTNKVEKLVYYGSILNGIDRKTQKISLPDDTLEIGVVDDSKIVASYNLHPFELANPYLVLADFYSFYLLADVKYDLDLWLETALSDKSLSRDILPERILLLYEMLMRLHKALILISG